MSRSSNKQQKTDKNYLNKIIKIQSRLVEANFNLEKFMQLVADQMQTLTPATGVVVELVEKDEMVYRAATGTVANHIGLRLKREGSISGLCVEAKKILHSDDTETDPRVNLAACRKVGARSLVVAPLIHEGKPVGVLKILSKKPHGFDDQDVQFLLLMAGFIASGLAHQILYDANKKLLQQRTKTLNELKIAQEKLIHFANYDFLTNLPNRKLLTERLSSSMAKAKRNKSLLAIMFLDIDHFKDINDTYGHDIGDELLKAFSTRLKTCVRNYDFLTRLGGDEFIILFDQVIKQKDIIAIAEKIIIKMNEKFSFGNLLLKITTSIGITFYIDEKLSQDELIKQADQALYLAKEAGRHTYRIFN